MNNLLDNLGILIQNNYWLAPILAILAGLLTSFTPCSLSSIPLIIGYVGNTVKNDPKASFKLSLVFALGSAITYTSLGVVATLFGKMIRLTGDWWYILLAILLITVVLQLWDIISIIPQNNLFTKNKKTGYLGALITGVLAGLFSSPCSTPVLIALLAIVSAKGNLIYGIILLFLYSIGHSVLLVMAGTSISFVKKMKNSKNYVKINQIVKIIFGLLIIILALYLFYLGM